MKRLLTIGGLLSAFFAHSQESLWSPDSLSTSSPNFAMSRYHQLLGYHDQLMYLAFPLIDPLETRKIPLRDGEGKNGYWLEGNFSNRFVIHKGKYYNPKWLQRVRFTFDVGLTPRLTRDDSSPLLPSNNKFGLGLDLLVTSVGGLIKERTTPAWITIQLLHYSNGQADSFFIKDEDGNQRHNYRSGDFSTNSLRILFNVANVSARNHVISTAVGWQKEIDFKGPLGMNGELYNSYGKQRLLFSFQWLKASRLVTINNALSSKVKKVTKKRQFSIRTDLEYILGDLSNFTLENKYRLGAHTYLTYMPSITNEVGFLIHGYVGRDYLNIRYDDAVFIGEVGLYMRINKK
ncbi:hypothetical protein [Longitalea luteola]|uniref:hypothetical protein n=1 Tax=Longitalea luteola TaxID=2812563 RepID=UPI001A9725E4|nr:hypothetical protein [Longitalea luteola]